jgi:WD40 repeat protein
MGSNASEEHKLAVMEQLVKKLQALRDYDRFDPKQMGPVVVKRNYREVERVPIGAQLLAFQVLPDGRVVSASQDGKILILAKEADGQWSSEVLSGHSRFVLCLQALPDGRIMSGHADTTIRIWTKGDQGRWSSEVLSGHTDYVRCLQSFPDGRIVSGSNDGTIRIWTKGAEGQWSSEVLRGHTSWVSCLQSLPDGRIVSGSADQTIRIWTKGADGEWNTEVLSGHELAVVCLQSLPDGRIVSGSADRSIRIWAKTKDSLIRCIVRDWLPILAVPKWESEVFSGHTAWVNSLQVLPDARIFSGSNDGTIRIWDGEPVEGECI